jgi:hypothetical protein
MLNKKIESKKKLIFKKGVNTLRFPVILPIQLDNGRGDISLNPAQIVSGVLKYFHPRKGIEIEFVYKVGNSGEFGEVIITKK